MDELNYLLAFREDRHSELTSLQWAYRWKAYTQSSGSNIRVISSLFVRPFTNTSIHHSHLPNFTRPRKGIIVNVSAAFTSFELMPRFYLYGYGLPFYNSVSASSLVGRKEEILIGLRSKAHALLYSARKATSESILAC